MPESTFTLRVDDDLKEAFTEAAKMNDRTGAQLLREYMRHYVQECREQESYEAWYKGKVEAGLRDIREERVYSHETIIADAARRREHLLKRVGQQTQ